LVKMASKPTDANVAMLHHNRAKSLMALGRTLLARAALDESLRLVGDHCASLEKRSECSSALFEHVRAAEDLQRLQEVYAKTIMEDLASHKAKMAGWSRKESQERLRAKTPARELLGLAAFGPVDPSVLRSKYRALSFKWHPDRHANASPEHRHRAHLHFQRINAAHSSLKTNVPDFGRAAQSDSEYEDDPEESEDEASGNWRNSFNNAGR